MLLSLSTPVLYAAVHPRDCNRAGVTIAEAIVAAACLAVFFLGLFAISGQVIRLLRASGQQAGATFCLEQRVEELRRLKWTQITDGAYIRDNVLNNAAGSGSA